jgi:hypothetical protein
VTRRPRLLFIVLAVATIGVGLAVHRWGDFLPDTARDVLGDALWAMMIAWWIAALWPRVRLLTRGSVALAVCWIVEFSQMYHTPALDRVRATTLGHLVLGVDFDPRDLAAYAAGVVAAVCLERLIVTSLSTTRPASGRFPPTGRTRGSAR